MTKKLSGYYIVFIGSLFYCYEFFLRVSPSAITDLLMHHFKADAGGFAAMSAAFFYAYMPMQVFAGLIGDRYGVKKVLVCCIAICSLSTVLFAISDNYWIAMLSRFFMGVSASFAYVGPLILASVWLKPKYYSAAAGLIQVLGSFGAYLVGTSFGAIMLQNNWQVTYIKVAAIGLVLMLLVLAFVKNKPKSIKHTPEPSLNIISSLKTLINCSQTRWIALLGFAFWAPMSIFGELWGVKFLNEGEGVSLLLAGEQMQWLWLGVAIGGPCWGALSCYNRTLVTKIAYISAALSSCVFLFHIGGNILLINSMLFVFGFACAAQCLSFGFMRDFQSSSLIGSAVGFTNMCVILGGTVLQPLSGFIIDFFCKKVCFLSAMQYTFIIMPLISLFGLYIIMFKIKDTKSDE